MMHRRTMRRTVSSLQHQRQRTACCPDKHPGQGLKILRPDPHPADRIIKENVLASGNDHDIRGKTLDRRDKDIRKNNQVIGNSRSCLQGGIYGISFTVSNTNFVDSAGIREKMLLVH